MRIILLIDLHVIFTRAAGSFTQTVQNNRLNRRLPSVFERAVTASKTQEYNIFPNVYKLILNINRTLTATDTIHDIISLVMLMRNGESNHSIAFSGSCGQCVIVLKRSLQTIEDTHIINYCRVGKIKHN